MNAGASVFVDTNVLLYSVSASEPEKQALATQWMNGLWSTGRGRLSWQVLHEFYSNAVGKLGVPAEFAQRSVERLNQWEPVPPDYAGIQRAWHWRDAAQVSFWDALILAAAEQTGCAYLISEDFQAGQRFGEVAIVDPFEHAPEEFGLPTDGSGSPA